MKKQKTYSLKIDEANPYWIEFNHVNLTNDTNAWEIYIQDNDGNEYLRFLANLNRETTSSPIIGLPKGKYIVYVGGYNTVSDAEYQLNVMGANISGFEKEPKDWRQGLIL